MALGASRTDDGHPTARQVLMTDPDGNEFCLLPSLQRNCPPADQRAKDIDSVTSLRSMSRRSSR